MVKRGDPMSTFNSENLAVKFDIKPGLYDLKILFYIHPYHQLNLGSLHYKWLLPSSTQNAGPRSRIDMKLMILVTGGLRIPKFILSRARMNQNCTYTPPPVFESIHGFAESSGSIPM